MAAAISSSSSSSVATTVSFDSSSSHYVEKINVACRFFVIGACRYGDNCRYLHIDEENASSSTYAASNLSPTSSNSLKSSLRAQAPAFVPNFKKDFQPNNDPPKSYADVVNPNRSKEPVTEWIPVDDSTTLCPYLMKSGVCRYETCNYEHGELCELCGKNCLSPFDTEQRKQHNSECIAAHEKEMELAFSIQRSKEKTCGICFDIVWEKDGREQRFGILPNCNHCFCLECIRTWRQAKQFDNKIIRACPECRTCSDFVCPSSFWVDTPEEKDQLITKYKSALSEKDCKYFKKGSGTCPFGNKCFYRHCLANGNKIDVGEPVRPPRIHNSLGNLERLQNLLFWDYLENRLLNDDLYDTDTDSDDSDDDLMNFF